MSLAPLWLASDVVGHFVGGLCCGQPLCWSIFTKRVNLVLQDGAQLQELKRDKADLEMQLEEKLEAERLLQQQLSDLQQAVHDPENWLSSS